MDLLKITIGDLLDDVSSRLPQNEALVDISKGVRLTYKEFLNCVNQLAKGFLTLGIKKAILLPSGFPIEEEGAAVKEEEIL